MFWGLPCQGHLLLAPLTQLTHLRMGHAILSGACFEALARVRSLQILRVAPTGVTASGLRHLSALTNLQSCVLRCPLRNFGPKLGASGLAAAVSAGASTSDAGARDMASEHEEEEEKEEALKDAFAQSCNHWRARRWEMGWPLTYTELSFFHLL